MRISFVVLCHNSSRHIERCVDSLMLQGDADEVIVVDNGSTDASPSILSSLSGRYPGRLKVLTLATNLGTTRPRNLALAEASGDFLGIVDSDVWLPPGAGDALVAILQSDRQIGMVVPQLRYPSGALQLSYDVFPTIQRKLQRLLWLRRFERQLHTEAPAAAMDVDYAISACWLMRRDVLRVVGHFDERIFYAPEDADYCLRMWKAGLRVLYVPSVVAVHHAQEISRGWPLKRATWRHVQGLAYYFMKHRYWWTPPRRGLPYEREHLPSG